MGRVPSLVSFVEIWGMLGVTSREATPRREHTEASQMERV